MSRKKRLGPNYPPKVTGEVEIQPHICLSKACVPLPPFCPTASLILHLYQASKMQKMEAILALERNTSLELFCVFFVNIVQIHFQVHFRQHVCNFLKFNHQSFNSGKRFLRVKAGEESSLVRIIYWKQEFAQCGTLGH